MVAQMFAGEKQWGLIDHAFEAFNALHAQELRENRDRVRAKNVCAYGVALLTSLNDLADVVLSSDVKTEGVKTLAYAAREFVD